ncbi:L-rhamnose catabolism isomerase [Asticcacaulis sp. EMRT-3]|uniref:L-rhamnose catabolism isomerase n=1 Tax=Asticcacaulis sp. EMRT-3 TaxID=3040349 RepID=UPI0024AECDE1|nr:L-rhamnose catabolism isomerase [Asticcacaulis sp. EMRT-3]MDI7776417.1 L-rhamnose catabolism isomerase [Asticcacaulis sp. EMRT-3]
MGYVSRDRLMRGISPDVIAAQNARQMADHQADFDALAARLARTDIDIETVVAKLMKLAVGLPSWGLATGGTRFARFPLPGEPTDIYEKIEDCAVVHQLTGMTPNVSLHFPWDMTDDYAALRQFTEAHGLGFDAVNSNTFQDQPGQDQPGQKRSYKYGSLSHVQLAMREQAVAHNLDCIEAGKKLGSKALTVWVGDGSNFPGQSDFSDALDRYLSSMRAVYAGLPGDWRMFIEHKLYEPAFYSTVVQDWGTSILCAQALGDKAQCLVDLGHHAQGVNIEMIVARLARFGKLGGFHFNDSKYGDDDLDAGSINPFQLFLVFNELVLAEGRDPEGFRPAYMMDQSHNVTDPIESLLNSARAIAGAYAKALIVDRPALKAYQAENDVIMAHNALRLPFETDVRPALAEARRRAGGALDPIACYRAAGYRAHKAATRKRREGRDGGIV